MSEQNIYGTYSLYEAAFCLCLNKGFKLVGKKRHNDKVIIYLEGHDIHVKALEFYNDGKVVANKFVEAYRRIKEFAFKD